MSWHHSRDRSGLENRITSAAYRLISRLMRRSRHYFTILIGKFARLVNKTGCWPVCEFTQSTLFVPLRSILLVQLSWFDSHRLYSTLFYSLRSTLLDSEPRTSFWRLFPSKLETLLNVPERFRMLPNARSANDE